MTATTEPEVRPGTYQTIVRPHQLRRGDIFTETLGKSVRNVVIEKVTYGEILYRGMYVPVLFVYGHDGMNSQPVRYTRTGWDFLKVTRTGDAPAHRRPLRYSVLGQPAPEPFVY